MPLNRYRFKPIRAGRPAAAAAGILIGTAARHAHDRRNRLCRHDAATRRAPADINGLAIRAGELRGDRAGRAHDEPWLAAAAQAPPPVRARSGPAKYRRQRSRRNCRLASDT
jgi:hypothetical protein